MTKIFNRTSEKKKRRRLRQNMPLAERLLWAKLKSNQLKGQKFRRQYSIGPFIVDFYCPQLKLVIELDGESHTGETAYHYDQKRQDYLESTGCDCLRFSNQEIYSNLEGVLITIGEKIPGEY